MIIFNRELIKNAKSFFIWLISLVVINGGLLLGFETVADQAANSKKMLDQYPEAFAKALSLDKLDLTNILHYFASRSFLFIAIFGAMFSIMLASGILSKEESERTIEFLISKPVTRSSIITQKILCTLFYIVMLNLAFSVSNLIFLNALKRSDFDMTSFLLLSIGPLLIDLFFAAIGMAISVFITKTRVIISVSIGIVFAGYLLSILQTLVEKLSFLKYLSPFSYFNTEDMAINVRIQFIYIVLTILVVAVSTFIIYFCYTKKDIKA